MAITLQELATRFSLELIGDASTKIEGACTLTPGIPGRLSFLSNPRLRPQLAESKAAAIIVGKADAKNLRCGLVAADPYLAYAKIAALFDRSMDFTPGRHPTAVVAASAKIGEGSYVGPNAVIEDGAQIGAGCFIGPACVIGREASVGDGSRLEARAWIAQGVRIGKRASIQPGAVVGSRGFGNAPTKQGWVEVPQLGSVVVGDDVEIGANTTIDRGAIEDTVIEDGVKLDNQIQIAHNCRVGAHTAMAACVGVAGSTRIGARCMIGGAAGIGGHLEIADDVVILGGSMVAQSLREKGVYGSALPAHDARVWRRTVVRLHRIKEYEDRIKAVERHLGITAPHKEESSEDDV